MQSGCLAGVLGVAEPRGLRNYRDGPVVRAAASPASKMADPVRVNWVGVYTSPADIVVTAEGCWR